MTLKSMAVLWTAIGVAGCAVTPLKDAADATAERVRARTAAVPAWPPDEARPQAAPLVEDPLTLPGALAIAFTSNPDIRLQYARLGIAHADLRDAARIGNPTFSLAWMSPRGGGRDETAQSISESFADLLLLPARRRLSAAEFRRMQLAVASALVALAGEVETAWYAQVGALQVVAMRTEVAEAAQVEATLAQRYFEAGNIARLQFDLQQAEAARTRIDAHRARSDAAESRRHLADLLALPAQGAWRTLDRLAAPLDAPFARDDLTERALTQRLDLAAAREEVALLEDALGVTRRWRLMGVVDVIYEREVEDRETRGPTLTLELPIFNQRQGAVERAEARLLDARVRADALALVVENEVTTAIEQLALASAVSDRYRRELLPAVGSAVARQQEQVNFMLESPFELFRTKRDQYNAWQGYFESVRDYWIARSALRAATGGLLPGDESPPPPTIGPDDIVPGRDAPEPEDETHEHHGDSP